MDNVGCCAAEVDDESLKIYLLDCAILFALSIDTMANAYGSARDVYAC